MAHSEGDGQGVFRRTAKTHQKVEFASFVHFLGEMQDAGIGLVRADVFEEVKRSELSFLYYVSLTLFVTAQDSTGFVLYEYREPIATITATEETFRDDSFVEAAEKRRKEVESQLSEAGITVKRGRFTTPQGRLRGLRSAGTVIEGPFSGKPL